VYVVAPVAVNVDELPEQIVDGPAETVTVGTELTVTTTVAGAAGHAAADVPFNVYVIVLAGLAVTLAPVVAVKLVLGVQVYVEAPLPVKVVELPEHIVTGPVIPNVGVAFTVTIIVAGALLQPDAVPVTVYVVVDPGETLTVEPLKKPGIQKYVEAPLAVRVVEFPEHMVGGADNVTVGVGFTVTTTVAGLAAVQTPFAPVTVYVEVVPGDTLKVEPVEPPGVQV